MKTLPATVDATIVIVSKNRADELRDAIQSAMAQQGASIEVLVIDDGSTDGTAQRVEAEFPKVNFHRSEQSLGLVVERNRAAKLARGAILFSLDDDAIFSTPDIVAQTLLDFEDLRIGAVAIPYIEKNRNETIIQAAPSNEGIHVTQTFRGTAYAVRRDVFLSVAGFRDDIVHQGEEDDFAIRMLENGHFVRLGRADPIFHHESPKRSLKRMRVFGWRNTLLFTWRYVPFPYLTIRLTANLISGVIICMRKREMHWLAIAAYQAVAMILGSAWAERNPVSRQTYSLFRRLRKASFTIQAASDLLMLQSRALPQK